MLKLRWRCVVKPAQSVWLEMGRVRRRKRIISLVFRFLSKPAKPAGHPGFAISPKPALHAPLIAMFLITKPLASQCSGNAISRSARQKFRIFSAQPFDKRLARPMPNSLRCLISRSFSIMSSSSPITRNISRQSRCEVRASCAHYESGPQLLAAGA